MILHQYFISLGLSFLSLCSYFLRIDSSSFSGLLASSRTSGIDVSVPYRHNTYAKCIIEDIFSFFLSLIGI